MAWNESIMVFFNFLNFLLSVGTERNGTKIFILSHSHPFLTYFRQKCCNIGIFFIFWIFLAIFLKFCITRWVGMKRNENFYFYLSHPFPTYFEVAIFCCPRGSCSMGLHEFAWAHNSWMSSLSTSLNFFARALVTGPIGTWTRSFEQCLDLHHDPG